jgi:peptidylprolyl isomerase
MKRLLIICFFLQFFIVKSQTQVDIFTNYGDIRLEMYDALVPNTVNNFVNLVNQGFYDGVIFHRVIDNFMIQGGDGSPAPPSIIDEFDSTLSNVQKTISMANSGPNTGTCQFFINLVDNTYLDFDKAPLTSKHPVFGITITGFNVVQAIGNVQTNFNDVPYVDVVMDSVRVVNSNVSVTNIVSFEKNKLINLLDFSGKSLIGKSSNPQIHIYENGLVEKKIILE